MDINAREMAVPRRQPGLNGPTRHYHPDFPAMCRSCVSR